MALNEQYVEVTTKYGKCPSFAVCPAEGSTYPGIIFYMDAPGYRTELENMARRIAKNGYFCLLPDMYYRLGTCRFDIPRRNDGMSAVIFAAMHHLDNQMVVDDTGGWIAWMDGQDQCATGPIGVVGHCMSGQYVTAAAANYPTRITAAASMYGVGIVTDKEDSPHLRLDDIKGEILFNFAEVDHAVPDEDVKNLRKALKGSKCKATVKVYKDTVHGFQFSERDPYHPVASEQAWDAIFALWKRNLKKRN